MGKYVNFCDRLFSQYRVLSNLKDMIYYHVIRKLPPRHNQMDSVLADSDNTSPLKELQHSTMMTHGGRCQKS